MYFINIFYFKLNINHKIVVLKFGGTSVGSIDRIKKVAEIIKNYVKRKIPVIVISSAMSGAQMTG